MLATLLVACGGAVEPEHGSIPERPLPSATTGSCGDPSLKPVELSAREVMDGHTNLEISAPVGLAFSDCPATSAVRVDSTRSTATSYGLPFDRPRSLLAFGPGYFPTRTPLLPIDTLESALLVGADVLKEDVWRPRLPGYRSDAPTVVLAVGAHPSAVDGAGGACTGAGVSVRLPDAPAARITYLGDAPGYAPTTENKTSGSGLIVIDGLVAGPAPRIEYDAPGCAINPVFPMAPLENGVVSLQEVISAAP